MTLPIKKAVIEVCGSCNYSCAFCPQAEVMGGREKSFKRMMKLELFKDTLDQLMDSEVKEIFLEGSGEPTMHKRLNQFITAGIDRGFKMSFISNGSLIEGDVMKGLVDHGLHFVRFSVTGYDPETYHKWMSEDNFISVRDNAIAMTKYIEDVGAKTTLGSYHLILNNDEAWNDVDKYRKNWIDHVPGIKSSIWKMHNWSGIYDEVTWREKPEKRSCGRPFSPDLIVRAGGNDGKTGAVVPCCLVLGQDSKAVMGHLSDQTIDEIWNGEPYNHLRKMHKEHRFDEVDYCKNCDMLYDAPDSLVWSNFEADYNKLTAGDFTMEQYRI